MNFIKWCVVCVGYGVLMAGCANTEERSVDTVKSSSINVELGITYMREGKYDIAMDRLQKALRQNPANPLAYSSLALLNMQLQQIDEAEKNFEKATDLAPDNSSIKNNYGTFLCQQKRYDEAQKQFLAATKNPLYQTPEYAYLNAGKCTEDLAQAEKYFRIALQRNPQFPAALYEMSRLSFELKRYLPARAYLQRFHAVRKPTAASLWLGIQVEDKLKDRSSVAKYAKQLQSDFPDSEETRLYLEWSR